MTDIIRLTAHLAGVRHKFRGFHEKLKSSGDEAAFLKLVMEKLPPDERKTLECEAEKSADRSWTVTGFFDHAYPPLLRKISSPPYLLFSNRELSDLGENCVAVVGARKCTEYGKKICNSISYLLSARGFTLVSGMAAGIDSICHRAALECSGKTVGVAAWGLDHKLPSSQAELQNAISRKGYLITEYPPPFSPDRTTFPTRNRLISGLCSAVIVVEAEVHSGSLITAKHAFSQNRDLFVVPGRLGDEMSAGCLLLAHENKARIIFSLEQFAEQLTGMGLAPVEKLPPTKPDLTDEQSMLLKLVLEAGQPVGGDLLSRKSGIQPSRLSCILLELELKGLIRKLPGNVYSAKES
ncbi:MAG: DNA-processing protein DprA [Candidatus Wallbacteria bacterium]|nr:DNA-processing protein DprA [Candidatus Wallbacteria bacterium]